jgi:hypothetical protein
LRQYVFVPPAPVAMGRLCHSTPRAECGHSLRVRGGKTSTARADIQTTVNTEFFLHRRKAALSPMFEYGFLAARARSTENAAIAKSSTPPRGGKTGHSCKAQQDKSVELTDCGQSVFSLRLNQCPLPKSPRLKRPRLCGNALPHSVE